jgi:hypothetical protein
MELQDTSANSYPLPKAASNARRAIRYSLHANAVFAWRDERGRRRAARGYTRDISMRGAYVVAAECPPRGACVSINVYLPGQLDGVRFIRVNAEGLVLRVDSASGERASGGFSMQNKRVLICEN